MCVCMLFVHVCVCVFIVREREKIKRGDYKEPAHVIVEAGNSEICRQRDDPAKSQHYSWNLKAVN